MPHPQFALLLWSQQIATRRRAWAPIQRIEDPHHPRGYRELRSPAEMKKLLKRKIAEQGKKCGICGDPFTDFKDVVPDHFDPPHFLVSLTVSCVNYPRR